MGRAKHVKKLDPVTIRLDPDVRHGIEAEAKSEDRSLSGAINRVLRQHLSGSTVLLPGAVREALERLAKADKRSVADYVARVLEEHIERASRTREKPKPAGTKT